MAFMPPFLLTLLVDILCIASVIVPDTYGLFYRAFMSLSVYTMPAVSATVCCLLKRRFRVLVTCDLATATHLGLHWEDWTFLSLTVVHTVTCFVATARSGGLQAVQIFHDAPVFFTLFMVTLVSLALAAVWVAFQAIHIYTTGKVRGPMYKDTLIYAML